MRGRVCEGAELKPGLRWFSWVLSWEGYSDLVLIIHDPFLGAIVRGHRRGPVPEFGMVL